MTKRSPRLLILFLTVILFVLIKPVSIKPTYLKTWKHIKQLPSIQKSTSYLLFFINLQGLEHCLSIEVYSDYSIITCITDKYGMKQDKALCERLLIIHDSQKLVICINIVNI